MGLAGGAIGLVLTAALAWSVMDVSTGDDVPASEARVVPVVDPAEAPAPTRAPETPRPRVERPDDLPRVSPGAPPDEVVADEEAGLFRAERPQTLDDVAEWALATDADYDTVMSMLPVDLRDQAEDVFQTSRDTLVKLRGAAARGEIPVGTALAAIDHQRKVVARRLGQLVPPDVAESIDQALGVGPGLPELHDGAPDPR